MALSSQEGPSQTESDVAAIVLAAEGVLTDLEQFRFSSVGIELPAAAEEVLTGESPWACCRFAGKVTAFSNEAANTL